MNKQVLYWINESFETLDAAKVLLDKGKYLEGAYFCNLACEKMLKGAYVHVSNDMPPKIHSLPRLWRLAQLDQHLTIDQKQFLDELDIFQLEARYPRDRQKLYKITPEHHFTQIYSDTEELIIWIKSHLMS